MCLLALPCLDLCVNTQEPLNRFSWNLILRSFTEICQHIYNFGSHNKNECFTWRSTCVCMLKWPWNSGGIPSQVPDAPTHSTAWGNPSLRCHHPDFCEIPCPYFDIISAIHPWHLWCYWCHSLRSKVMFCWNKLLIRQNSQIETQEKVTEQMCQKWFPNFLSLSLCHISWAVIAL
jgi:hypothetical protein